MDGRRTLAPAVMIALVSMLAGVLGGGGCGGSAASQAQVSSAPATPSSSQEQPSVASAAPPATEPKLASPAVDAALTGRIAAMNERDGEAAAAFYTQDGVLVETDLSPHLVTRGRDALAARFNDLYDMGLRLAPAGAPISYDRYVVEPVRFFNGNAPGRGAGMLVFESGAGGKFARQWMVGWVGGPQKTFTLLASPSPERPNLPPAEVTRILEGRLAAVNRGDGADAAAFYTEHGVVEQLDSAGSNVRTGRDEIAALVKSLYDTGLRMEPAGAPITYDCYVAEPVRFSSASGPGSGAAMLVFAFAPSHKIKHEYMIGPLAGDGAASPSSSAW